MSGNGTEEFTCGSKNRVRERVTNNRGLFMHPVWQRNFRERPKEPLAKLDKGKGEVKAQTTPFFPCSSSSWRSVSTGVKGKYKISMRASDWTFTLNEIMLCKQPKKCIESAYDGRKGRYNLASLKARIPKNFSEKNFRFMTLELFKNLVRGMTLSKMTFRSLTWESK